MAQENQDGGLISRYLLGRLQENELEQLEERMMVDTEFYEQVLLAEDEMIEAYVNGELPESEASDFRASFMSTPEGKQQVAYTKALLKHVDDFPPSSDVIEPVRDGRIANDQASEIPPAEPQQEKGPAAYNPLVDAPSNDGQGPRQVWWRRAALAPYLAAAAAVIVIGVGLGIWEIITPSEASRGSKTLAYAYRDQRPIEARISGFDYAPASTTRGGEPKVDKTARNLAESILLDAVVKHPNAATHHAAGRLYLAEKKFDEAIEQFEAALKEAPNNAQLQSDYGAALLEKGKVDRAAQDGRSLEELAQSLEHLSKALDLDGSLLESLFNRALCRQELTLFPQAEEDWRAYLEKDSKSKWADEARQHLESLEKGGNKTSQTKEELFQDFLGAYQARDDEKAWKALSRSRARTGNAINERLLDAFLALVAHRQTAQAEDNLRMLSYAGNLEIQKVGDSFSSDLARYYQRVDPIRRETLTQARSLMKSASEKFNQSEFDDAAKRYSQAQRLFEQSSDTCESLFAESWFGNCLLRIPDTRRSLATFERLSRTFEEKKYRWLYAQALNAISDAQSSVNEISKALDLANRSMQACEQIEDAGGVLRNLQQLMSMHLKLGNYHESLQFSMRAFDLARAFTPDPKQIWPFYHETALDFYWLGSLRAALEFEKEALRVAIESKWPTIISRSFTRLGLIYERLQNNDEAIRNGQFALEQGERIESESGRLNITANALLRLGYLYRKTGQLTKAIESYDQAIQSYGRLKFQIYLYEAHKGKLLAFIDLGSDSAAKEELDTALKLFEQYRTQISEESNRNSFFDVGQNIYDIAAGFAYSRMNDPQKAFEYSETSRARSLLDLMRAGAEVVNGKDGPNIRIASVTEPLPLSEIQRRLPDQVQILQYTALDDKLLIWVISKTNIEGKEEKIASDELSQKVFGYLDLISKTPEANTRDASGDAKQLYSILIAPVEQFLNRQKQLCIVPDKFLNYLPYWALISPVSGKYFVEDFTFEFSPSSNIFVFCTEEARKKEGRFDERVLSVGDPTFERSRSLPDLPSAAREAEQVAACYNSVAFTGERATERQVWSEMVRANVVHLATHYVINERSPLLSSLLLAKESGQPANESDGVLQAYEIYNMKLPQTRLVVLSACQTGIEHAYSGEGAISIARPFISAGVPIVVASLWAVDSDSTANLMIRFHKHRKQDGLSTTEALRLAQLDMLNNADDRYRRPYYWASFATIGGYATF